MNSIGPSFDSEHYDIEAKTDGKNGADPMLLMLQALIEDRFQLRFHHEAKEGPVYVLTVGKNGSKMHEASCVPLDPNNVRRQVVLSEQERANQCRGISRRSGEMDGNGVSMEDSTGFANQSLAGQLSLVLDRPVINKTALSGLFDVHLRWTSLQDTTAPQNPNGNPTNPMPSNDDTGPSIFTAVQEQLGLRLESGKGPVEMMVIDHVEKPSEN